MRLILFFLLSAVLSCAGIPEIIPAVPLDESKIEAACGSVFLSSSWRLVHSIEAVMPDGSKGYVIGITAADPVKGKIHAVIMSIEGLVVFEAESGADLRIIRAMPPFDSQVFAAGLMNDIRLIFFRPGEKERSGLLSDGSYICRYKKPDGNSVDVICSADRSWKILLYDGNHKLLRSVRASVPDRQGLPSKIDLKAVGLPEYSLHMELIESEKLQDNPSKSKTSGKKSK